MEPEFPFECIVLGTPVSQQRGSIRAKQEWKDLVRQSCAARLPQMHFASERPLAITLYYYPVHRMTGDLDNIVKLTLDAMNHQIYRD